MPISFSATKAELELIDKIIKRTARVEKQLRLVQLYKSDDQLLDLRAANANGCPMDFAKLLAADEFNFIHDIYGIRLHLDRETGALLHCFLPRCAKPERIAA